MQTNKLVGITMMYTNGQPPLKELPTLGSRNLIGGVPPNSLVIHTGRVELDSLGNQFAEVEYSNKRGWIYKRYLDTYIENLPKNIVQTSLKTPDPLDPEQFARYNGAVQRNLCGWFCMARILGVSLEEVLDKVEQKKPTLWTRIFGRKNGMKVAGGTTPQDLIEVFDAFGYKATDFGREMTDPVLKRSRYTVDYFSDYLKTHQVICSVNIDGGSGRLRGAGVLHWIQPLDLYPERLGYGGIKYYNSFSDRDEIVEWNTFIASARQPYGVSVVI